MQSQLRFNDFVKEIFLQDRWPFCLSSQIFILRASKCDIQYQSILPLITSREEVKCQILIGIFWSLCLCYLVYSKLLVANTAQGRIHSFLHSFNHLFTQYLSIAYCMPGTADTALNKTNSIFMELIFQQRRQAGTHQFKYVCVINIIEKRKQERVWSLVGL